MPTPLLSTRDRFLYGGSGAIAPILLSLLVVDLQTLLLNVTALAVIAYLIRFLILFAVGGFVGVLHKTEVNAFKLFQLGIAAPALITAALNGSRVAVPDAQPHGGGTQTSWAVVATAFAQTPAPNLQKRFAMPTETPMQQVYRGLFGTVPKNVWFVVTGSYPSAGEAAAQAQRIREKGFAAEVYQPATASGEYPVVIGAQMTLSDARELKARAVRAGLPKDTFLWTFAPK